MNETINNLLERRSVKKYAPDMVKQEDLDVIIKAGTYAPNGRGAQSAIIVAVTNKEVRDKLSRMNAEVMGTDIDPFYGAPVVLVVLGDKSQGTRVYDGSLVMGNMMNAAHALGLGSCWIHRAKQVFDSEEGKAMLKEWGIEGEYEGIGHCIIGYADGGYPEAKVRKDNFVYYVK